MCHITPSLVRHFVRLRTCPAYRVKTQSILICGEKLITELAPMLTFITLLVKDRSKICHLKTQNSSYQIDGTHFHKIMGMRSNAPMIAEVALPQPTSLESLDRILILERLQDPGNVGTLIRTAYGFGYNGVYLIDGGVDVFNDKVIRASSGAIFHLPFAVGSWDAAPLGDRPLFSADMGGSSFASVQPPPRFGLVLGSEGQGLSDFIKSKSTVIAVDQISGIDSLNVSVAGGILLHHFRGL